jgi:hypothetical protein
MTLMQKALKNLIQQLANNIRFTLYFNIYSLLIFSWLLFKADILTMLSYGSQLAWWHLLCTALLYGLMARRG